MEMVSTDKVKTFVRRWWGETRAKVPKSNPRQQIGHTWCVRDKQRKRDWLAGRN